MEKGEVFMKQFMKCTGTLSILVAVALLATLALVGPAAAAPKPPASGTTLAAVKTIDICDAGNGAWRYSGDIALWNEGAIDTVGLAIQDCIQYKTGGGKFSDAYCADISVSQQIPAGTTSGTAISFPYSFLAAPLSGDIRNIARVTITNHSGSLGKPFGPEPKATWLGEVGPCTVECGCTLSFGYWRNHSEWPVPDSPTDLFFSSGQTWQYYLDNPGGNGYNILAVQYIAALLDKANGSCVPTGVQEILDDATAWFNANGPSACPLAKDCGVQKDWGKILDDYIQGIYPGSPGHCGE
jgi:hypothetical protein